MAAPQVAPALTLHLPSFLLPCRGRRLRVLPVTAAPLVWDGHSGSSASSSHSPSLAGVYNFTPNLASTWCFAPARQRPHHTRRDLTPRVLQQWLSQLCQQTRRRRFLWRFAPAPSPSSTRVNIRAFDLYHLTLSRGHAPSSPVSSPRCTSLLSMPSTVRYRRPFNAIANSRLSRSASFLRVQVLVRARWRSLDLKNDFKLTSLDSNTTIWALLSVISTHLGFLTRPQPGTITRVNP